MMWGDGMGWMWVFWILLVLGTVVLVFVLIKVLRGGSGTREGTSPEGYGQRPGPARARAREILEERYARGEISTEEFRERLRTLDEGGR